MDLINEKNQEKDRRNFDDDFKSKFRKKRIKKSDKPRIKKNAVVKGAERQVNKFRQSSILAISVTGFILLLFSGDELSSNEQANINQPDTIEVIADSEGIEPGPTTEQVADEAIGALQNMWNSFTFNYPKILIAIVCLVLAWFLNRLMRFILRRSFGRLKSIEGIVVLVSISIWAIAVGVVFSVVAGDIRALIGSFGLIGLALSWALQTPIESFTGWLLNTFRRYYKVGDRIRVGDVFGDVYRIDFLATTVWEIGSPYQPGFVSAEQPTGRLVTFPNNQILTGTVINLTGDFPFVWDEIDVVVANESDIPMTMEVLEKTAGEIIGDYMLEPARQYSKILRKAGLAGEVPEKPQVFVSASDSWTSIIIRYLVGANERRKWKTNLHLKISAEIGKPEYKNKIIPVYPRQQIQFINADGMPVDQKADD